MFSTLTDQRRNFTVKPLNAETEIKMIQECPDNLTHKFLRAHHALTATEEVRLERYSGSKWFEPQLPMIKSHNPTEYNALPTFSSLNEEDERRMLETSGHCRKGFLTVLNTAQQMQAVIHD